MAWLPTRLRGRSGAGPRVRRKEDLLALLGRGRITHNLDHALACIRVSVRACIYTCIACIDFV